MKTSIPDLHADGLAELARREHTSPAAILRRALARELLAQGLIDGAASEDAAVAAATPIVASALRNISEEARVRLLQLAGREPERLASILGVWLGNAVATVVEADV